MTTKTITVQIPAGLEARPVAVLVQVANQYSSSIYLKDSNRRVSVKSMTALMTLGLHAGEQVTIEANGDDETNAVAEIENYLSGDGKRA